MMLLIRWRSLTPPPALRLASSFPMGRLKSGNEVSSSQRLDIFFFFTELFLAMGGNEVSSPQPLDFFFMKLARHNHFLFLCIFFLTILY